MKPSPRFSTKNTSWCFNGWGACHPGLKHFRRAAIFGGESSKTCSIFGHSKLWGVFDSSKPLFLGYLLDMRSPRSGKTRSSFSWVFQFFGRRIEALTVGFTWVLPSSSPLVDRNVSRPILASIHPKLPHQLGNRATNCDTLFPRHTELKRVQDSWEILLGFDALAAWRYCCGYHLLEWWVHFLLGKYDSQACWQMESLCCSSAKAATLWVKTVYSLQVNPPPSPSSIHDQPPTNSTVECRGASSAECRKWMSHAHCTANAKCADIYAKLFVKWSE